MFPCSDGVPSYSQSAVWYSARCRRESLMVGKGCCAISRDADFFGSGTDYQPRLLGSLSKCSVQQSIHRLEIGASLDSEVQFLEDSSSQMLPFPAVARGRIWHASPARWSVLQSNRVRNQIQYRGRGRNRGSQLHKPVALQKQAIGRRTRA